MNDDEVLAWLDDDESRLFRGWRNLARDQAYNLDVELQTMRRLAETRKALAVLAWQDGIGPEYGFSPDEVEVAGRFAATMPRQRSNARPRS